MIRSFLRPVMVMKPSTSILARSPVCSHSPLIANVIYFSLVEVACGFAPNYKTFLILRCLYGIGMGGEWGVGASLAMENAPARWRGILSGILQSGYSIGYLLAAVASHFILPTFG